MLDNLQLKPDNIQARMIPAMTAKVEMTVTMAATVAEAEETVVVGMTMEDNCTVVVATAVVATAAAERVTVAVAMRPRRTSLRRS